MLESTFEFNGVVLNDQDQRAIPFGKYFKVTTITGLDDPDVRDERVNLPGADGEIAADTFYGGRSIVFTGELRARTLEDLRIMQIMIQESFGDLAYHDLIFTPWGKEKRFIRAKKNQKLDITEEQTTNNFRRTFTVGIRAEDPFAYSYIEYTSTFTQIGIIPNLRNYQAGVVPKTFISGLLADGLHGSYTHWNLVPDPATGVYHANTLNSILDLAINTNATHYAGQGGPYSGDNASFITNSLPSSGTGNINTLTTAGLPTLVGYNSVLSFGFWYRNVDFNTINSFGNKMGVPFGALGINWVSGVGTITASNGVGSTIATASVPSGKEDNGWHFVLYTRTGTANGDSQIYFDGVPITTVEVGSPPASTDAATASQAVWVIDTKASTLGQTMFAHPMCSNIAWSSGQVAALYAGVSINTGIRTYPKTYSPEIADANPAVDNLGNYESFPVTRLYGYMQNPTITNLTTGQSLVWDDLVIQDNSFIEIDHKTGIIQWYGYDDNYSGFDLINSEFWSLQPGVNEIEVSAENWDGAAYWTIVWRNVYL